MVRDVDRVLVSRQAIAVRVRELGRRLARDLENELAREGHADDAGRVVLVPILTGSIVFVADLLRELPMKLSVGVVAISSYPGRSVESKGAAIRGELPPNLAGRHVVIVDDIFDSGQTLSLVRRLIEAQRPASLRVCVLLRKDKPRAVPCPEPDYVGFDIPDEFVVGYGLDFDGYYRNHPEIVSLRGAARTH